VNKMKAEGANVRILALNWPSRFIQSRDVHRFGNTAEVIGVRRNHLKLVGTARAAQ
jgi:hypothetical protein